MRQSRDTGVQRRAFGHVVTEQFASARVYGAEHGLAGLIKPLASSATGVKGARPAFAVKTLPRFPFLRLWFGLFDPAVKEAPHYVLLCGEFACPGPGSTRLPDETIVLQFGDLLETHLLNDQQMVPPMPR